MRRSWTIPALLVMLLGCRGAVRQSLSGGYRGSLEGISKDGRLRLYLDGRADYAARDGRSIAAGRWRIEDDRLELRLFRVESLEGPRPEKVYRGKAVRIRNGMRWLGRDWLRV